MNARIFLFESNPHGVILDSTMMQRNWKGKLSERSGFGIRRTNQDASIQLSESNPQTQTANRNWSDLDHWVFGDPEQVVWIAGLVFLVSYRVFRFHSSHHYVGCMLAITSAIGMFVLLVWNGYVENSDRVLASVLTIAAFGYSGGTVISSLVEWFRSQEFRSVPLEPKSSVSEALSAINQELDSQLAAIDSSDIDADTQADLKQTARDKAEEKMALVIEADNANREID